MVYGQDEETVAWAWASKQRRRELVIQIRDLAAKLHEFMVLMQRLPANLTVDRREVEGALRDMDRLGREVKSAAQSIIEDLSKGMIDPLERVEMARLTLSMESVVSHAIITAHRLAALEKVTGNIKNAAEALTSLASESTLLLVNALERLDDDPAEALVLAGKIGEIEELAHKQIVKYEPGVIDECRGEPVVCVESLKLAESLFAVIQQVKELADSLRLLIVVKSRPS